MKKATTPVKTATSSKPKPATGSSKHIEEKKKAPVKIKSSETENKTSDKQAMATIEPVHVAPIEMDFKNIVNELAIEGENKPKFNDKWPLVMDENERLSTFFRHRDCNYINCLEKDHLESDHLRIKILGALRYNKPLIIDLMDNMNLLDIFKEACEKIDVNLYKNIMDTSIRKEEIFMELVKSEDGSEFSQYQFNSTETFKVVFLITKTDLPENFQKNFVSYLVKY